MKNNKGFTLTELIAIIVLISIFALIAGPNLTKQIKTSDTEEKKVLSQNIENASMIYVGKYHANKLVEGQSFSFELEDLVSDGLLILDDTQCNSDLNNEIFVNSNGEFDFNNISCH